MAGGLVEVLASTLQSLGFSVMNAVPYVVAAIVVLIVGYVIASIVGWLVHKVLDLVQFEHFLYERAHLKRILDGIKVNHFLGLISKWYVFALFFGPAATFVKLYPLAVWLDSLYVWIPKLLGALLIGFAGFIAADYVRGHIHGVRGKGHQLIADVANGVILVFTALLVLDQVGLKVSVATNSFLIILGALGLGFALAVGLAFGLGMQKEAGSYLKQLKRKL